MKQYINMGKPKSKKPPASEVAPGRVEGHILKSIDDKVHLRRYAPISDSEISHATKAGLAQKKGGKISLTEKGYDQLREFTQTEKERELKEGTTFDKGQEKIIQHIEKGQSVTQQELDQFGLSDSEWAKKAVITPIEEPPTPKPGRKAEAPPPTLLAKDLPPPGMQEVRRALATEQGISPDKLEFVGVQQAFEDIPSLYLYNIMDPAHENHQSTVAYPVPE